MQIPIIAFILYDLMSEHLSSSSNIFRVFGSPTPISTGHSFFFHLHLFFFTFLLYSSLLYFPLLSLLLFSYSLSYLYSNFYSIFFIPPPCFLSSLSSLHFIFLCFDLLCLIWLIWFDLIWFDLIWFALLYFALLLFAFLPLTH